MQHCYIERPDPEAFYEALLDVSPLPFCLALEPMFYGRWVGIEEPGFLVVGKCAFDNVAFHVTFPYQASVLFTDGLGFETDCIALHRGCVRTLVVAILVAETRMKFAILEGDDVGLFVGGFAFFARIGNEYLAV